MPEKNNKKEKKPGQLHNRPVRKELKLPPVPKPMKLEKLQKAAVSGAKAGAAAAAPKMKYEAPGQMGHSPAEMGHSPAEMSPYKMGHSPAEMGHSPAEMGHSPAEMETKKQEKYNLLHDNPVAKDASGGRSWMSKHANQSRMGSPLKGHCMNK